MKPFSQLTELLIAATVLDLLALGVLGVTTVLQFCFVRRHDDPARHWLPWARWSMAVFAIILFILCGSMIIRTVTSRFTDRGIEFFQSEIEGLGQATGFLDGIWRLLEAVFRVQLLVTFACLSAGIAMARSAGGRAEPGWTGMKRAAMGAGGLTLLLATGLFGLRCYFWAHRYDKRTSPSSHDSDSGQTGSGDYVDLGKIVRVATDMDFTLHCIWLFLALVVLALAVRTRALSRSAPQTRSASNYLLVCSILFAAQPLYNIIIFIIFYLGTQKADKPTIITDAIFGIWLYLSILLVLFSLGRKKVGGVWSVQQAFVTKEVAAGGATVYQTPWGYQTTHHPAPDQSQAHQNNGAVGDSQAQLNNYYGQPYHGEAVQQHQQQPPEPHYG